MISLSKATAAVLSIFVFCVSGFAQNEKKPLISQDIDQPYHVDKQLGLVTYVPSEIIDFSNLSGDNISEVAALFSKISPKIVKKDEFESSKDHSERYGLELIKTKYKDRNLANLVFVFKPSVTYNADTEKFSLSLGDTLIPFNQSGFSIKPYTPKDNFRKQTSFPEIPVPKEKARQISQGMTSLRVAMFGSALCLFQNTLDFNIRRVVLFDSLTGEVLVDKKDSLEFVWGNTLFKACLRNR